MALVSLGSCFFTMCGMNGFKSSTMTWDAARVSAAIPSGVGFLGAGLIWKGNPHSTSSTNYSQRPQVHGLATAAGVWLSSAIGVGVGGRLYVPSTYAVILVICVLRLPKSGLQHWDSLASHGTEDDLSNSSSWHSDRDGDVVTDQEQDWLLRNENLAQYQTVSSSQADAAGIGFVPQQNYGSSSLRRVLSHPSRMGSSLETYDGKTVQDLDRNRCNGYRRMRKVKSDAQLEFLVPTKTHSPTKRKRSRFRGPMFYE
eukprot:CAMPEP_0197240094 /NCGR_PEP_ID=MMETSP1429-20130617/6452_1 /TAXON_ID=49237 /ORGANISM="Chaetoceros  sp., Strain UNC1202" /LENGTH=255 /DNA_ID=CAMNT_0042699671 /DNA_START=52 /DNA_END=819 /DNA_ORIENTATION=+